MDRGRVKQVWVMGNTGSRMQPEDILGWHVRNANGEMVPIGTFAKFEWATAARVSNASTAFPREHPGQPACGRLLRSGHGRH